LNGKLRKRRVPLIRVNVGLGGRWGRGWMVGGTSGQLVCSVTVFGGG